MAVWPFAHIPEWYFPLLHIPDGHLPPGVLVVSPCCELYDLFPLVIRTRSLLASGILEETDTQESILKKITYALEAECLLTTEEITRLIDLSDPDRCPSSFLPLLADYVSIEILPTWSVDKRKMVVKAAVLIWMMKGMHLSWRTLLHLRDMSDYLPWELWKQEIYEDFDYSPYMDYYHRLKSARFDFTNPNDPYDRLPSEDLERWMEVIECVRPIHVLPRPYELALPVEVEIVEVLNAPTEQFIYDTNPIWTEEPDELEDELTPVATCVHWCESACQLGAEYLCASGCETGCQSLAETGCLTYAEFSCASSCQLSCQISCEFGCETYCETGVETGA